MLNTRPRAGWDGSYQSWVIKLSRPDPIDGYLPIALEQADALVVFGGPMSVNDPEMAGELLLIEQFLQQQKPCSICLGAQFLNGAYVGQSFALRQGSSDGLARVGEQIDCLRIWIGYTSGTVNGWIQPMSSSQLQGSARASQAIQNGVHWSVQFHPEVDDKCASAGWIEQPTNWLGQAQAITHM